MTPLDYALFVGKDAKKTIETLIGEPEKNVTEFVNFSRMTDLANSPILSGAEVSEYNLIQVPALKEFLQNTVATHKAIG